MRKVRYIFEDREEIGVVAEDLKSVHPLNDYPAQTSSNERAQAFGIEQVRIITPRNPGKIVCVGRNYAEHAAELGNDVPQEPLLFLKAPTSIIYDDEFIEIPGQSSRVEHEGELGVVVGKRMKNLSDRENPFDFVLGFVCLNDVTARDLQRSDVQFTRAKSFDTFCPVSRFVTTGVAPSDLRVLTRVNGIVKQDGRTSQMVFPVDFLLRYISRQMTLEFGDIVATGTPAGVSELKAGDVCEVEIEKVGRLSNPVRKAV